MNKLLIGLLIVAAGAGVFFLIRKNKHATVNSDIKKEWIIGQWKNAGTQPGNSNFSRYSYDFRENGNILRSLNDSVAADTSYYEWTKNNELLWKEKPGDSTGSVFAITRLTKDSLQLQSKDSVTRLFIKIK